MSSCIDIVPGNPSVILVHSHFKDVLTYFKPKDLQRKWHLPFVGIKGWKKGADLIKMDASKSILHNQVWKKKQWYPELGDFL